MHRNAPLTPEGRRRLVELIESGWTVAAAAESMQLSRQCAHKWWRRYLLEGDAEVPGQRIGGQPGEQIGRDVSRFRGIGHDQRL